MLILSSKIINKPKAHKETVFNKCCISNTILLSSSNETIVKTYSNNL